MYREKNNTMPEDIIYTPLDDGFGFRAMCNGMTVGSITFVRVGIDKIIIDHTEIHADFTDRHIDDELVRRVVDMARGQNRKIMCMCPIARAVFGRTPEYDDIRLVNVH